MALARRGRPARRTRLRQDGARRRARRLGAPGAHATCRGPTFELPLDTLLVAISQHAVLDLFGAQPPGAHGGGLHRRRPVHLRVVDPGRVRHRRRRGRRTRLDRQGGCRRQGRRGCRSSPRPMARQRAHEAATLRRRPPRSTCRRWSCVVPAAPTACPSRASRARARRASSRPCLGYTAEEAMAEAGRCLDCHTMCSLCVGVCPNLALMTYRSEPFRAALPDAARGRAAGVRAGDAAGLPGRARASRSPSSPTSATSAATARRSAPPPASPIATSRGCTSTRADFEAQSDNAFRLLADGSIEARWDGADPPSRRRRRGQPTSRRPLTRDASIPTTLERPGRRAWAGCRPRGDAAARSSPRPRCSCCCEDCAPRCPTCRGRPSRAASRSPTLASPSRARRGRRRSRSVQ